MTRPALALPVPALRDERAAIVLRPWHDADAPALAAAWTDPEIAARCGVPADAGLDRAATWISGWAARVERGIALDFVVADATGPIAIATDSGDAHGAVLGEVGLWPFLAPPDGASVDGVLELGWWIGPHHRGSGRASAAVRVLADWALLDLGADKVVARIGAGHAPSEAVARRAGLSHRGRLDPHHQLWARSAATVFS